MKKTKKLLFQIDFDGTCVLHDFPRVGKNIGAQYVLKALTDAGHDLMLWTVRSHKQAPDWSREEIKERSGEYLNDAIKWFADHDIPLKYINEIPKSQKSWTDSPKPHVDFIIDDLMIGNCVEKDPFDKNKKMVNWKKVFWWLFDMNVFSEDIKGYQIDEKITHEMYSVIFEKQNNKAT